MKMVKIDCSNRHYSLLSFRQFPLWNGASRVCRGTACCVAAEANLRFAER